MCYADSVSGSDTAPGTFLFAFKKPARMPIQENSMVGGATPRGETTTQGRDAGCADACGCFDISNAKLKTNEAKNLFANERTFIHWVHM